VLGLERGTFLHAGPPIEWERASGPLRGALIGAMLYEELADSPSRPSRRSRPVTASPSRPATRSGPSADGRRGQPVDVDVRAGGPRLRRPRLVLLNEGLGKVLRYGAYGPRS
jgi:hypothetical protein